MKNSSNSITHNLAKHAKDIYLGGNWTASSLKDQLKDVTWEESITPVYNCNTIATLVYHLHYYVRELLPVFDGEPLKASDKLSFSHPPIASQSDWKNFQSNIWSEIKTFATHIEKMEDNELLTGFENGKYGNYFRNIFGIIEHAHYHLGQIVILKKVIRASKST